ncbi:hypothetical protein MKW94_010355 [Papaver nudicaule]|uniref:Myb-like domain-containing protein n=1 Tax=Papaver nudicaule TaxID=74823 RepID=A0AA41S0W0_PAPNU|nr:hypothetical protein [Papaver nudicaule]
MDLDIAGAIIEYLVRLPTLDDDNVIKTLLDVLPTRKDDHRLIKSILLRKLSLESSKGLVSEKTLETLERIEESDFTQGVNILDSMSEAYCAVAVHCAVVHLKKIPIDFHSYLDAVVRIWRGRICDLEKCGGVGLCSDKLKEMRCLIEEALWNESVRQRVLTWDTQGDAVRSVKGFLVDAMKQLGPSMMEIALRTVNAKGKEVYVPPSNLISEQPEEGRVLSDARHLDIHVHESNRNAGNDMALGSVMEISHAVNATTNFPTPEIEIVKEVRKTSATDLQTVAEDTLRRASKRKYNLSTSEVRTVQEALKSSLSDLRAVVQDPLPDALRMAKALSASMAREGTTQHPDAIRMAKAISASMAREATTQQNSVLANEGGDASCVPSVDKGVTSADEGRNQSTTTRPSLMGRNNTARTYEWTEDPIESSQERSPGHPHLSTTRRIIVSPLPKHEYGNNKKMKRKWSPQEEQTLRDAVNKHGRGNWTFILNKNRDVFVDRSALGALGKQKILFYR